DQPEQLTSAKLLVGVHRRGGLKEPLKIEFNGQAMAIDNGDSGEFSEFFAPLDLVIPADEVQENNVVKVFAPSGTTITSVQLETYRSINGQN
ncbi:MAG: hypothetical protein AAF939_22635, partial [Planctomycetota bacterium]